MNDRIPAGVVLGMMLDHSFGLPLPFNRVARYRPPPDPTAFNGHGRIRDHTDEDQRAKEKRKIQRRKKKGYGY